MSDVVEMVFSPEQEALLGDAVGFSVEDKFTYVPKAYREVDGEGVYKIPKEHWPKFSLKSKDGYEIAMAEDRSGYMTVSDDENKFYPTSGKMRLDTLEKGVCGIANFPVKINNVYKKLYYDKVTGAMYFLNSAGQKEGYKSTSFAAVVKYMSAALQLELMNAINERTNLTPEELQGLG